MKKSYSLTWRSAVTAADPARVRDIVASTGFFYDHEVDIAVELVDERLLKGEKSGYFFVFAETEGRTAGYACFGPIACTSGSYDLFWIAVHRDYRDAGIGRQLLLQAEQAMAKLDCRTVYVETASREHYLPTREFYKRCGYAVEAVLKDFYDVGDDKVIFTKRLK